MEEKVRSRIKSHSYALTLLCWVLCPFYILQAQSPGDIAIVGFNTDGDDSFSFVALSEIEGEETIKFADAAWNGSHLDEDGRIDYTTPAEGLQEGDVIVVTEASSANGNQEVNRGEVSKVSSFNLINSGAQLYAFLEAEQDTTFLHAVTNRTGWDDEELEHTGLEDGQTALSNFGDGSTDDNARYNGSRTGTKKQLLSAIAEVPDNWETSDGTGDQSFTFEDQSFSFVEPPLIGFSDDELTVNENDGSIEIDVELVEAAGGEVSADVSFMEAASSAETADISDFSTETVQFDVADEDGTIETITVDLADNTEYDGAKQAIFQLKNISVGHVTDDDNFLLNIQDDDVPEVVINEVMPDPGGEDLNNDGDQDNLDDEFVEIVNNQDSEINISNWSFSDAGKVRHVFPEGTVLEPSSALVLFSRGEPTGDFGNARVQVTSENGLNLNNSDEHLEIADTAGNPIDTVVYSSSSAGVSLNRDEDLTGEEFTNHSEINGAIGNFSPGTQADGAPFDSTTALSIAGVEGWRMIATPTKNTTFEDLLSGIWTQGITGSSDPEEESVNLFFWDERDNGSFKIPQSMDEELVPGLGYIIYLFEDDDPNTEGIQGGFPKTIRSEEEENDNSVPVQVSATDNDGDEELSGEEGWNLLGNPFETDIFVDEVIDALNEADTEIEVNKNIYIWDSDQNDEAGGYRILTAGDGETIAPFQAFWVRFEDVGLDNTATFERSELEANRGTDYYKERAESEQLTFDFRLNNGSISDQYSLTFREEAEVDRDPFDAYKLFSLNEDAPSIYTTEDSLNYSVTALPLDIESRIEIPLTLSGTAEESSELEWEGMDQVPESWDMIIVDHREEREIDLTAEQSYSFTIDEQEEAEKGNPEAEEIHTAGSASNDNRFSLMVDPNTERTQSQASPESIKLNPNFPNPFSSSTTVSFELDEPAEVTLNIYSIVGQHVATLLEDEEIGVGEHRENWNPVDMPSGVYIAQLEVGQQVFIRKMTLIK